jgi:hypothetical protein
MTEFQKNTGTSNFIKIRPVGAELFNADRQIGRPDKANSCFLSLCEQLVKKEVLLQYRIRGITVTELSQCDKKKTDRPSKHNFIKRWSVHFLHIYIPTQWNG